VKRFAFRRFAAAAVLSISIGLPGAALALPDAQSECRDTIAESITRYAGTAAKAVASCHKRRSAGARSPATECNDVAVADDAGKTVAARTNARAAITSACASADELLANYPSCPAPASAADDGGLTTGIDDFGEVADCLLALADVQVGAIAKAGQGDPQETLTDPLRKCQGGVGKGTMRVMRTVMSERRRCQKEVDEHSNSDDYACTSSDPRGRVYSALVRYQEKTSPICNFSPDVLSALDACSDDANGFMDCSSQSAVVRAGTLIRDAYVLGEQTTTTTLPGQTTTTLENDGSCGGSAPTCDGTCPDGLVCQSNGAECHCAAEGTGHCAPATIRRSILSRFSPIRPGQTALNAGWSGIAMDIDMPDGAGDWVDVECDDNCENCEVHLKPNVESGASACRCTSDPTQTCNVINGSDPDSCGSLDPTCRCYFGAPLPVTTAGNPACVGFRIRDDYKGTMNLRTGEWHDSLAVAAVVYLGVATAEPCPTCDGDPVPNDGIRGGTCSDGLGTACDVNGAHSTFGKVSNDCLPPSAANISGAGLIIDVNFSTDQVTLGATLPCDTPAGRLCHCRTCTGNTNVACSSDSVCAQFNAGVCTASGGAGVRLNQCTNFDCSANGNCTTGPIDRYCDNEVYPDGRGYTSCQSDGDCASGGHCTIAQFRRCFPDPIVYEGSADPYGHTGVSAFCVAPTSNPAINIASGLPGPGGLLVTFADDIRCQNDPSVAYQFPSGANCEEVIGTTTTTLLPLPECGDTDAPECGGLCPTGSVCGDNGSGTCVCTELPLPSCDDSTAPVCGGICSGQGEVCEAVGDACQCMVVTLPQCTSADAPVCGGLCPTGEVCASVGSSCECGAPGVPTCGSAIAPTCAGLCDINQACIASGDTCQCVTLPVPLCGDAATPLCGGACSTGSTCGQVGDICQCTPIPLEPPALPVP